MSGLQKAALPAGVPIQTNIPEVIRLLKANKLDEAGRKAGIVRCYLKKKRTIPARSGERALQGKNSSLFFHHIPLRKIFPCFGQDFAGAGLNVIGGQREVSAVGTS